MLIVSINERTTINLSKALDILKERRRERSRAMKAEAKMMIGSLASMKTKMYQFDIFITCFI